MPYCSQVGKLAGYDETEIETVNEDLNDRNISVEFHVWRSCAECGDENASVYDGDAEFEFDHECGTHQCSEKDNDTFDHEADVTFSLDLVELDVNEAGGHRYQKKMFSVTGYASVTCDHCTEVFEVDFGVVDSWAASSFESEAH